MAVDLPDYWSQVEALLSMDFVDLQDTPTNYIGDDTKSCVVDEANDQLIFDFPIPAFHAADHENGGVDEISVAGLSGELADNQKSTFLKLSDTPANYVGAALKSLRVNAATNAVEFAAASTNVWRIVQSASPAAAASVSFVGLSPGTWYEVVAILYKDNSDGIMVVRFNTDVANNYTWAGQGSDSAANHTIGAGAPTSYHGITPSDELNEGYSGVFIFRFCTDPNDPTRTHIQGQSSYVDRASRVRGENHGGIWDAGVNLASVQIVTGAGSFTGEIKLLELEIP